MILVTLPGKDVNGNPANIVILRPKFEIRDAQQEMQYKVIVLWEDVPGAKNKVHPETAEVFLYRNGSVAQSMVLGTAENWQYTWTETDPSAIWAALETVSQGYTVRYERQGNTLIIINTPIVKQHQNTTEDKLPQTGQLWWPVPILAMSGFVLLLLGWLRRKESRNET
jgi:LPXTG-motif cell wall-anchored protein